MSITSGSIAIAALLAATVAAAAAPRAPGPGDAPDLILTGGHVKTADGWAEALAVRRGVIVAVGTATGVGALRGPNTRVVGLDGGTVLPGLHDAHVHPIDGGISERRCKIRQGSTLAETQAKVRECANKARPGEWVTGGQWDAPALGGVPDRRALDAVVGTHPALLDDTSGHSAWVNTRALALAGITKATPDPAGGIIERDASGEPSGVLRESAIDLVRRHVPVASAAALRDALRWSLHEMLSVGITSYTEAAVGFIAGPERELRTYAALADAGEVKQRVTLCITWAPGSAEAERAISMRNLYARPRVAPDCVKIFLDGVPTDGHTAAMLEPYADTVAGRDDEAGRKGMLLVKQAVLNAAVTRFDAMGLTVKFHAAGDAAVRAGLDAIAAARQANGFTGQMHNVGHCTFVAPEDLSRARAIGATFEVSPYLWAPSPINDAITAAVGPDLIRRVWPVREMLEAGALVVPGSDWSVVPSVNPWIGIETLVTREVPGGSKTSFGKVEAIAVKDALDLFTVNAARQARRGHLEGRIEPGMLADVIVVDQNPYDIPANRLHETKVRMTFIEGEKVYDAAGQPDGHHR
jgi:predicted amidohydrolase YtcJ